MRHVTSTTYAHRNSSASVWSQVHGPPCTSTLSMHAKFISVKACIHVPVITSCYAACMCTGTGTGMGIGIEYGMTVPHVQYRHW